MDVSTRGGVYEGLAAYYSAVEACNALNGVGDPSVLVLDPKAASKATVAPKAHGRIYKLFHREEGASVPSPAIIPAVPATK